MDSLEKLGYTKKVYRNQWRQRCYEKKIKDGLITISFCGHEVACGFIDNYGDYGGHFINKQELQAINEIFEQINK